MFGVLLLLFLVAPLVELYVIVQVAGGIGVPETIVLLLVVSAVGASLAKAQGLAVLGRLQQTIAAGRVPAAELVDGALIILAGALMIAPGFISDCMAILLLLPPTRFAARSYLLKRIRAGGGLVATVGQAGWRWGTGGTGSRGGGADRVWEAESWEQPPPGRPELDR
ncbi:MAG: FxsA family protein [Acidimicrobiales bacterium]|nr:FxsA family protein [Acidimicrobiales bacterium]